MNTPETTIIIRPITNYKLKTEYYETIFLDHWSVDMYAVGSLRRHNNHGPRSEGRPTNGSNGHPDSRSGSGADAQPNARVPRDSFSQRSPAQSKAVKADAGHGARSAAPSKSQPSADIGSADGMRLNKAIAATGLCSRRKADELILAGRVSVDGKPEANPWDS